MRARSLWGEGAEVAARQAALLYALAGTLVLALAVTGLFARTGTSTRTGTLLAIASADLACAAAAWLLPRFRPGFRSPYVLCVPALAIQAWATWTFAGLVAGTGPFLMLLFAWAGLHLPVRAVLALAAPATLAYLVPLVATDSGPAAVYSTVLLIPAVVAVGLIIARQAGYQRRANERLRRAEQWRAALTSTLAHDVRSPLTSVRFALESVRDEARDLSPEELEALAAVALRQASRIRRLADGLLDADRVDSEGGLRLDLRRISLRETVEEVVSDLGRPVEVDVGEELTVPADPQRLEQILLNLLANAVRHGAPPVAVSAERAGGTVLVHVRDHGRGVPPERRDGLFSRFGATGDDPQSVGLGLWITRELARAHGGDVRYTDTGRGACFTVVLPSGDPT
jgi:signal transduction histidine kinase